MGNEQSYQKIAKAYVAMAEHAGVRPAAPSDGLGNISLSSEEIEDRGRLGQEASGYAVRFMEEEDTRRFFIGTSAFETKQAFVWVVEAARALAAVEDRVALRLLKMATKDLERVMKEGAPRRFGEVRPGTPPRTSSSLGEASSRPASPPSYH
jgi:hypothetical protein